LFGIILIRTNFILTAKPAFQWFCLSFITVNLNINGVLPILFAEKIAIFSGLKAKWYFLEEYKSKQQPNKLIDNINEYRYYRRFINTKNDTLFSIVNLFFILFLLL
jgi:hypothetical protein